MARLSPEDQRVLDELRNVPGQRRPRLRTKPRVGPGGAPMGPQLQRDPAPRPLPAKLASAPEWTAAGMAGRDLRLVLQLEAEGVTPAMLGAVVHRRPMLARIRAEGADAAEVARILREAGLLD